MTMLQQLRSGHKQSPWVDNVSRRWLVDGTLNRLVSQGIVGVTSNPTIFAKAIGESNDYDAQLRELVVDGKGSRAAYWMMVTDDIASACDVLRPVWDKDPTDGYVSVEVAPTLAHDAEATIRAARELWSSINRPNVMIKVPATDAGIVAIKALVESGINVNVTLIFTPARYRQVLDAFIAGTENRVALVSERGDRSPTFAHSVASFFVSRTDAALQTRLESVADGQYNYRVASALALLCYEIYEQAKQSDRWQALADVRPPLQRLLWASVAPKSSSVDPLLYVNNLCLPETVVTLPQVTLDALMSASVDTKMTPMTVAQAHELVDAVVALDVDLLQLGMGLEDQGLEQFAQSFDSLLEALAQKALQ